MKICITSQRKDLDSQLDPLFGRCQYFLIVDPDAFDFEAIPDPNLGASGGAGIQSAQLVASKQVRAVLIGNVGPNSFQTLQAAGIKILTGLSGKSREVLERYQRGELQTSSEPTVNSHFGSLGKSK